MGKYAHTSNPASDAICIAVVRDAVAGADNGGEFGGVNEAEDIPCSRANRAEIRGPSYAIWEIVVKSRNRNQPQLGKRNFA
jgi:hypothetical protein